MTKRKEQEEKTKYEFPEYTKEQLKELEQELEKYRITKIDSRGKEISFYDDDSYLMDKGALSRTGAVLVTGYCTKLNSKGEPYSFCDYPSKYEVLRDKIEQLYKMQSKKEYAIKKSLESLEENMQVVNETTIDI